jgi:4'-phosphopantetheinyl transferase EntD
VLRQLFPDDVVTAWGDPADPAEPLFPEEEALVARAVPKRRREFAKGRECARTALARLGFTDVVLLSGKSREPLWPTEAVGSITHTAGLCAVAVGRSERYAGLGIDAEPAEPLAEHLARRIGAGCDWEALAEVSALSPSIVRRLVFSVKEAVYKCVFPLTHTFLGFEDVSVELEKGSFRASLAVTAAPLRPCDALVGRWVRFGDHLVTSAWIDRPDTR